MSLDDFDDGVSALLTTTDSYIALLRWCGGLQLLAGLAGLTIWVSVEVAARIRRARLFRDLPLSCMRFKMSKNAQGARMYGQPIVVQSNSRVARYYLQASLPVHVSRVQQRVYVSADNFVFVFVPISFFSIICLLIITAKPTYPPIAWPFLSFPSSLPWELRLSTQYQGIAYRRSCPKHSGPSNHHRPLQALLH